MPKVSESLHLRKDEFALIDSLQCLFHSAYWRKFSGKEWERKWVVPNDWEEFYRFLLSLLLRAADRPTGKKEQRQHSLLNHSCGLLPPFQHSQRLQLCKWCCHVTTQQEGQAGWMGPVLPTPSCPLEHGRLPSRLHMTLMPWQGAFVFSLEGVETRIKKKKEKRTNLGE